MLGQSVCIKRVSCRSNQRNSSQQYLCSRNATVAKVITVASQTADEYTFHRRKSYCYFPLLQQQVLDLILSLSNIRTLSNSTAPTRVINVMQLNSAVWMVCALQSSWTRHCKVCCQTLLNFSEKGLGMRLLLSYSLNHTFLYVELT